MIRNVRRSLLRIRSSWIGVIDGSGICALSHFNSLIMLIFCLLTTQTGEMLGTLRVVPPICLSSGKQLKRPGLWRVVLDNVTLEARHG